MRDVWSFWMVIVVPLTPNFTVFMPMNQIGTITLGSNYPRMGGVGIIFKGRGLSRDRVEKKYL